MLSQMKKIGKKVSVSDQGWAKCEFYTGHCLFITLYNVCFVFSSKLPVYCCIKNKIRAAQAVVIFFPHFSKTLFPLSGRLGSYARRPSGLGVAFQCCRQMLKFIKTAEPRCLLTSFALYCLFFFPNTKRKPKTSTYKMQLKCKVLLPIHNSIIKSENTHRIQEQNYILPCLTENLGGAFHVYETCFFFMLCKPEARVVTVTAKETQTDR